MPRYRVDWTEEVYTYIESSSAEEAMKSFEDGWLNGNLTTNFNEYSEPRNVEIVAPNGDITQGEI